MVDDNEDSTNTMRMVLGALGHTTFVACDGLAALEAIRKHAPEIVLLDIGLPGLSGLEVARRVHQEIASPPGWWRSPVTARKRTARRLRPQDSSPT